MARGATAASLEAVDDAAPSTKRSHRTRKGGRHPDPLARCHGAAQAAGAPGAEIRRTGPGTGGRCGTSAPNQSSPARRPVRSGSGVQGHVVVANRRPVALVAPPAHPLKDSSTAPTGGCACPAAAITCRRCLVRLPQGGALAKVKAATKQTQRDKRSRRTQPRGLSGPGHQWRNHSKRTQLTNQAQHDGRPSPRTTTRLQRHRLERHRHNAANVQRDTRPQRGAGEVPLEDSKDTVQRS